MRALSFHGQTLHLCPSGALFLPDERLLCVSDLHLGKSERLARRGGALLPPYETQETLARLDAELAATHAQTVICLGDSFDDGASLHALATDDRLRLARLMAGRHWIWVEGNHDAGPLAIAGTQRAEVRVGALTFRHRAQAGATAEVSGHFHPKLRLAGKAWRAFLMDDRRMILPAFGAYTGGLWAEDPVLSGLMGKDAVAVLCGPALIRIPMPRTSTTSR